MGKEKVGGLWSANYLFNLQGGGGSKRYLVETIFIQYEHIMPQDIVQLIGAAFLIF